MLALCAVVTIAAGLAMVARLLRVGKVGGLLNVGLVPLLLLGGVLLFDPWFLLAAMSNLAAGLITMVRVEGADADPRA